MNTILWNILRTSTDKLPPAWKRKLKLFYYKSKKRIIDLVYAYSYPDLLQALREVGINCGDIVMVHSSFSPFSGFRGNGKDIIRAFKEAIGAKGTLLMVSMPYIGSSREYLEKTKVFDVNRAISMMGLISETFRRQKDVVRSLHPTHPILAFGPQANWFVQGHENCLYPCGPGSPFEKLAQKDGKVLFFDASLNTFTFFHYLEHLIQDKLPFSLYGEEILEVKVVNANGQKIEVKTKAFSFEAIRKRRSDILWQKLLAAKKIKKRRIGTTDLRLVKVRDAISCVNDMTARGEFFYEFRSR